MKRPLIWFGIGFIGVMIGVLTTLWMDRKTIEDNLLSHLIEKISPSLPFKISSYQMGKNLDSLSFEIRDSGIKVDFSGPIHFKWLEDEEVQLQYEPLVQIEGADPLKIILTAHTEKHWNMLYDLELTLLPSGFAWPHLGIATKDLSLHALFHEGELKGALNLGQMTWTEPGAPHHEISLTKPELSIEIEKISRPELFEAKFLAQDAEILWGEFYLDLPMKKLPLQVSSSNGHSITATVADGALTSVFTPDVFSTEFKTMQNDFQMQSLDVSRVMPWVIENLGSQAPFLKTFSDYIFKKGSITASGRSNFDKAKKKFTLEQLQAKLADVNLRSTEKKVGIQGLNFHFNYSGNKKKHNATVSARALNYMHFSANLAPTEITWDIQSFENSAPLPLEIKGVPLSVGKVSVQIKPEFKLATSVSLKTVDATPFANGFCFAPSSFPPLHIHGDFPKVEISSGMIDPTGKLNVSLFGGNIELNELGFYDLDSDIPETDFDVDWSGISLEKLGQWSNFGEIKGTLEGYAHDVVFQSFLPTQYHFLVNVAPYDQTQTMSRVEFSPESMKNVVKVFTGADLDEQIPGIAGWLMFGWPSHVFGGYDVYYAGLKLTSENGHIIVETLDKPGIFELEQKHFVLYGKRFKMPLRNTTYPLIVDAASMSNFVHQLLTQLQSIQQSKKGNLTDEIEENTCEPPEL